MSPRIKKLIGTIITLIWIPIYAFFVMGVAAATGGIGLMYFVAIICSMFGVQLPFLHSPSPIGIAISIGIVIVAALNLIIDFASIQQSASY